MSWGVILMYGGAIVVATSLAESGATIWMAESIVKHLPLSGFIFIVLIALLTKGITEGISNVAAVAIILPVAFSTGSIIGVNPVATTLLVALSGGLAFCLPMGTPPNAIAFSSGYYSISEVVKVGIYLNIISIIVITLVALFYWPLVGLVLTN
jgi:solute carrier family 13 (sodium-dependent dicarboxylate transporter), member 2/3/5